MFHSRSFVSRWTASSTHFAFIVCRDLKVDTHYFSTSVRLRTANPDMYISCTRYEVCQYQHALLRVCTCPSIRLPSGRLGASVFPPLSLLRFVHFFFRIRHDRVSVRYCEWCRLQVHLSRFGRAGNRRSLIERQFTVCDPWLSPLLSLTHILNIWCAVETYLGTHLVHVHEICHELS